MKLTLWTEIWNEGETGPNYFLNLKCKRFSNQDTLMILTCAGSIHSITELTNIYRMPSKEQASWEVLESPNRHPQTRETGKQALCTRDRWDSRGCRDWGGGTWLCLVKSCVALTTDRMIRNNEKKHSLSNDSLWLHYNCTTGSLPRRQIVPFLFCLYYQWQIGLF